jgi:tetratricopeptide (TPR) repeat protein
VAREGNLNRDDAGILLCAIYRRERRPEDAVPLLEELIPRFPRNYILRLEMVQMHSDLGNKEEALAVIRDMQELKRSGAPGYADLPAEKIMFSRGTLLFWYRDLDQALEDFKRVTAKTGELDLNTEVLAWLRLGQTHDLLRQRKQAIAAYRHVIRIAPDSARAKQSRRYLRTPYKRKDVS